MGGSGGSHYSRRLGLGRGGVARSLSEGRGPGADSHGGGTRPGEDQTGRTPGGAWSRLSTGEALSPSPRGRKGGDPAGDAGGQLGRRRYRAEAGPLSDAGRRRQSPGQPARARSARAGPVQVWEGSGRQMAPLGQTGRTSLRELGLARFPNPSLNPTVRVGTH